MKKIVSYISYIVVSVLIVMLINYDFKWKVSWYSFVLGLGIFFLLKKIKSIKKINWLIFLNAFIFAIFLEVGVCYQKGKSLAYLWSKFNTFLISILSILVFTFILYLLLDFLFMKFQNMKSKDPKSKILQFIFYKHPFLCAFIFTIFISGIYLMFYYPGSMAYDGMWQLDFYYNIRGFSDHHPAVLTLIMGSLMDFGRNILNDNFGMFMYILPQVVINALIYAYVLKIMNKMETPFIVRLISLLFYSCFPLLVMNSITYIKDTIFYLIFLLLFVYMYYHFRVDYNEKKSKYIVLALLYLGLYLTRNTGFYITFIMSIAMALISIKKEKEMVIGFSVLAIFITGVHITYQKVFLPKMNIDKASVREMMSVPFQQTARYLRYYPDDLSQREREVLEDLFAVDLKEVGRIYNPNRSDNVKWEFKKYPTSEELKSYIEVWFTMFLKHPFIYVDATINNIYGYFYPNVLNFIGEELGFYYIYVKGPVNTGEFNLYWNGLKKGREALEGLASKISKTDGIKLLYAPAFYVWILISASFYLIINKKRKALVYFVSLFVVLLCAIISPVNGHMRYVQPIMVSVPFILAMIYNETRKA